MICAFYFQACIKKEKT
jgi:hypothetical protein